MRILVVTQYYYPEMFRINDICQSLAENGHEITVLTGLPNYPHGTVYKEYRLLNKLNENINGVRVIRCPILGRGKTSISLALNYVSFIISASIRSLFIGNSFDIVFVYQLSPITSAIPAIIYSLLNNKRMLLYCLDIWPASMKAYGINESSILFRLVHLLSMKIYQKAERIFITSRGFRGYLEKLGVNLGNITYLPQYCEDAYRRTGSSSVQKNDKMRMLYAGNIGKLQNLKVALYAMNMIRTEKTVQLHIVGDGSEVGNLKKLSDELHLEDSVYFYNAVPIEEICEYYSTADAFLITLTDDDQVSLTLPAKVQSYMASGKPIIAAAKGEVIDIINEARCGLVAGSNDYVTLARNILYLANKREQWEEYGKNARTYYEVHFKKEKFMEQLVKEINIIINRKGCV